MASMEEDFPRGGTVKKPAESQVTVKRPEVDNLFQSSEQVETKKRKGAKDDGKKLKKQKTEEKKAAGLTLNTAAKCVEILHAKNVKEGMLLLGCVKEVSDFEVTVSLPCGLLGFLSIRNVCDAYAKLLTEQLDSDDTEEFSSLPHLFHPGMVLRCAVAKLDVAKEGSLSIQLSVNPKLVNKSLTASSLKAGMVLSGCVESVEDHGYVVDIGVSGTKAFLQKNAVATKHGSPEELNVGQYVTYQIQEVKSGGRLAHLSVNPAAIAQACADAAQGWSLTNLLPGLLVNATVKQVTKHGLLLDFLSSFTGQVDFLHMEPETSVSVGAQVRARVLYVEPSTRLVGLSLRGHLAQPGAAVDPAPAGGDRISQVVTECKMTALHHMSGAMMELPDKTAAFVHRNHLKESSEPSNDNKVLARPEHTCRIMDFSPMDQIHFVTLRKSVIDKPFFRYHDLQAGLIVEGTVSTLLSQGMVVRVSDHIKGLVPRTHLSDIVLKNPEKKYMAGMKVKCRVLSVEPENRKLYLTRKKALVDSALPLFLSYSDARPGRVSHGFIVCIKDFGCIVRFYNNVKGLVPIGELSSEHVVRPQDLFYVGQVLKTKVLQCDPDKSKMVLSFKAALEGQREEAAEPQFDCEVGQTLEARVLKKAVSGLEVSILPQEIRAVLPTAHLSDHVSNCPLLWESLQEGDTVSSLVCFNRNKRSVCLTKKPAVRWCLEEGLAAKDFSEISVGLQLTGWIKNIMSYGVFVEFPYGLVGLAPKSAMTDKFISDTATAFQLGQTVVAKVTNLDEEKRRFLVTLKTSEVAASAGEAQMKLVNGLQERRAASDALVRRDGTDLRQALAALTVGERLKLTVDSVTDGGAAFKSDDLAGATIQATKHDTLGVNLTEGQKVTAVVLHVDIMSSCVHVSTLPKLLGQKKTLTEGSKYTSRVQLVDKDFAVVSLEDTARLCVIETRSHPNEVFLSESGRLKAGMTVEVEVVEPNCEELRGLPLVAWSRATPQQRQRAASESLPGSASSSSSSSKGYCFGQVVQGKVRAVKPTFIQVALEDGSKGRVHVSEVVEPENLRMGSFPTSSVKVGSTLTARVIGGREMSSNRFLPFSHPKFKYSISELTLKPSKLEPSVDLRSVPMKEKLENFQVGKEITCFVSKFHADRKSLEVTIDPSLSGTVELLAMITEPKDASHPERLFKLGQAVRATVVEVSAKRHRFLLSLTGVHKLEKGGTAAGMVVKVQPHAGLLVRLPFGGLGAVGLTDLADAYRPNPLEAFSKDQIVKCFLLDTKDDKWQVSLRPSRVNPLQAKTPKDPEVASVEQLEVGQIVRGFVKSVREQGVFIRLSSSITGRARLQQATKYLVKNPKVLSEHLPLNSLLTTRVLSVDEEEGLVDLSLLPDDTGKPDVLPESLKLPLRPVDKTAKKLGAKRSLSDSEQIPKKKKKDSKKASEDTDSGVEVYFREEDDKEVEKTKSVKQAAPSSKAPSRLQVASSFSWDVGLSALRPAAAAERERDSSDGEEEEEAAKPQKKSRHELEQEKKAAEKALVQREAELMDPGLRPQDASAFERLLLASPDSSLLWLQYMAHHLQATQIEQARAVAERALKTISFREEQEKLNVWVALLNLENMYGTPETLKKVFERAVQFCEPTPVYQQLADIYAKSDKTKEAEGLYKTMVKRFRQNKAVWLSYGTFLLQQGQSDAASALLQRALKSLPTKESVDVITKFAQLEFRYGDAERGRAMFDKVLTSYPKRTDLWSVFIDLMVKHGSQKEVRALFDRVIHLSVSAKKIKFYFKRYLEYEKKHGTPQSIQAVKEKAVEFVEAKGTEAAN